MTSMGKVRLCVRCYVSEHCEQESKKSRTRAVYKNTLIAGDDVTFALYTITRIIFNYHVQHYLRRPTSRDTAATTLLRECRR